jgi:vacuolar iron transporter family protein
MKDRVKTLLLKMQKNEITEYHIYTKLAASTKKEKNKEIIASIGKEELEHYEKLKKVTKREVKPNRVKVMFYVVISKLFGLSFGLKLMERGEILASLFYNSCKEGEVDLSALSMDEQKHEKALLDILSEERLEYAGSIVLGLNDALVELTGALAGLTFALQNNRLIALAGMVTGFAASLSMAASGYLSSKEEAGEGNGKSPLKAALYTGIAYVFTVIFLIIPYFVFSNVFFSLAATMLIAIIIIFLYTFYITTAKGLKFWKRFLEMALISLTIAVIGFFAGLGLKLFLGVDV